MPPKISELEVALQKAQERQKKAMAALSPKHKGGEPQEFAAASEALLQAERDLAAAKCESYAVPIEFPVPWDIGAPLPHLLQNEQRTFLIFFMRAEHPNWDGIPKVRFANSPSVEKLALVEFIDCSVANLGPPNDEVFDGHPLWGKGFEVYGAMAVENSRWIKEFERINSVHRSYKPGGWQESKHYILAFHDTTFECVARGFKVETYEISLSDLLSQVSQRLIERSS